MPVAFVHSSVLTTLEDLLPANVNRSSLVSEMIAAYKLDERCESVMMKPATRAELETFHDPRFLDCLLRRRRSGEGISEGQIKRLAGFGLTCEEGEEEEDDHKILEKYGLLYDCPVFPFLDQYVKYLAGSTISGARHLVRNGGVVINWHGGRHHAKKSSASGFCYVNDIVLGILELRKKYDRVVYVDLDLHHGDGVEGAFKFSEKVCTVSLHRKEIGFFPGTGGVDQQGLGKGKGYTVNIPLKHGLSDESLHKVIDECVVPVIQEFRADAIVVQCGADGLGCDEHGEWNLSIRGLGEAVKQILSLQRPVLLLGGGGYNHSEVARCWTYLTSIVLGDHTKFDLLPDEFIEAHPSENYDFWDDKGHNMKDENSEDYIASLSKVISSRTQSWN